MFCSNNNKIFLLLCLLLLTNKYACRNAFAQEQLQQEQSQQQKHIETNQLIAEIIKSGQSKKVQMQSKHWYNKKGKKKIDEEDLLENTKKKTSATESQEILDKYRELMEHVKEKELTQNSQVTKKEKIETQHQKEHKKNNKNTAQNNIITEILQRYKETQKEQNAINSRSFGSIE